MDLDTNVKSSRKKFTQALCMVLSVLFLTSAATLAVDGLQLFALFGRNAFADTEVKQTLSVMDTRAGITQFGLDMERLTRKTGKTGLENTATAQKDAIVKDWLADYRNYKAEFIEDYIRTLLEDLRSNGDNYADYERFFNVEQLGKVPKKAIRDVVEVDADAPLFIRNLQRILNGTKGKGFLEYADLIPAEAYADSVYYYEVRLGYAYSSYEAGIQYQLLDDGDPEAYIESLYADFIARMRLDYGADYNNLQSSVKYYVINRKTKKVFTNLPAGATEQTILAKGLYYANISGTVEQKGFDKFVENYNALAYYSIDLGYDCYVTIDTKDAPADDVYLMAEKQVDRLKANDFAAQCIVCLLCLLLAIGLAVLVFVRTRGTPKGIARIPVDLQMCVLAGLGVLLFAFGIELIDCFGTYLLLPSWIMLLAGIACGMYWALLCGFVCVVIRVCKSEERLRDHLLIFILLRWVYRKCKVGWKKLSTVFGYKAGAMHKQILLLLPLLLIVDAGLVFLSLLAMRMHDYSFVLFACLALLILNGCVAWAWASYLQRLDKIIVCMRDRTDFSEDVEKLPSSLRVLEESRRYTNDELDAAIQKAIKDERTKAELITNVSHDLKTPLTAVINYIDLLQQCGIEDETAKEYLEILSDKSDRLKRLIEDLIEASKVSTGNVTLNKTKLDLNELAAQAIVEEQSSIEQNGVKMLFEAPQTEHFVFADGVKIYRVLENLLSNARKYSAPDSRIYARVYADEEYGCFEIKNISKDPLNISADELTERFVRGDRARGEDGNGLGLSIASDLCRLNGGELLLSIDGDLFKAIVKLPKA